MGKSLITKLIGVGVAIVIAVVASFIFSKGSEKVAEAKAPKVGTCVNMTGSTIKADHKEIDCDDALASYEVVSDKGSCDEVELNYTISLGTSKEGNVADLCLAVKAKVGDCFDPGTVTTPVSKVACAEAKAGSTIVKVSSTGKAGDSCANGAQPLKNVTRDVLLCLVPAA